MDPNAPANSNSNAVVNNLIPTKIGDTNGDSKYNKRQGAGSGRNGFEYEINLTGLMYFKLVHNNDVVEFHLANNMDEVGSYDDICIIIKINGIDKYILPLIQVKHKDDTTNFAEFDAFKLYESYNILRKRFSQQKKDVFFDSPFENTECFFILYTNGRFFDGIDRKRKIIQSEHVDKINEFMFTGKSKDTLGSYSEFSDNYVKKTVIGCLNEEITKLADHLNIFLNPKKSMKIMLNSLILQYHVILATSVFQIAEDEEVKAAQGGRIWRFRPDFFSTEDNNLKLLRDKIYNHTIKDYKIKVDPHTHKNSSETDEDKLAALELSSVKERDVAKEKLLSYKLEFPQTFGNVDILIKGKTEKAENKLIIMANMIIEMCKKYELKDLLRIVKLQKSVVGDVFYKLVQMFGNVIGNLLVYDDKTKYLRIAAEINTTKKNCKFVFDRLYNELKEDIHLYRFDVKSLYLPKLIFDNSDDIKLILNKLLVFDLQSSFTDITDLLELQIKELHKNVDKADIRVTPSSMLKHYLYEIQDRWMGDDHLTKSNNIYQQAVVNILHELHISSLTCAFIRSGTKCVKLKFTEDAINELKLPTNPSKIIIASNETTLTTVKVIQHLKNNYDLGYAILDVGHILDLPQKQIEELRKEIKNTKRALIVVCNISNNKKMDKIVKEFNQIEGKLVIVITHNAFLKQVKKLFAAVVERDDCKINLSQFTLESQRFLIKNTPVKFQDQTFKRGLDILLDEEITPYVKGAVLNSVFHNIPITIGGSLTSKKFEEIRPYYIHRRVSKNGKLIKLKRFSDIEDTVVFLTAPPGLGKTTLVTCLSLNIKHERVKQTWIVRMNFIDYLKQFRIWHDNHTVLNDLHALNFIISHVILKNNVTFELIEKDGKIDLKSCEGNEVEALQIKVFLHFYNTGKLLLLLDGFDEICPQFKKVAGQFLSILKNNPHKNKLWVTSRPYTEILSILEEILGKSYELDYLNRIEQKECLNNIWKNKIVFKNLNIDRLMNLQAFLEEFSEGSMYKYALFEFYDVFIQFYDYVYSYFEQNDLGNRNRLRSMTNPSQAVSPTNSQLLGTPILLYLVADLFVTLILKMSPEEWPMSVSIPVIYKMFIQKKLKVLYEDKYGVNLDIEYNKQKYLQESDKIFNIHKQIAVYSIMFHPKNEDVISKFNCTEAKLMLPFYLKGDCKEFHRIRDRIQSGAEKTGVISHITSDDTAVFIHKTIEEYLAAEYLSEIIKGSSYSIRQKLLIYKLIRENTNIHEWILRAATFDLELYCITENLSERLDILECWCEDVFSDNCDESDKSIFDKYCSILTRDSHGLDYCFNKYTRAFFKDLTEQGDDIKVLGVEMVRERILANIKPLLPVETKSDDEDGFPRF